MENYSTSSINFEPIKFVAIGTETGEAKADATRGESIRAAVSGCKWQSTANFRVLSKCGLDNNQHLNTPSITLGSRESGFWGLK
jgi:hypothetical protein